MSRKSRLLRIFLVVAFVFVFAGYFAFSTFFFRPFESGLGVDVSALAPRDVDFFFARGNLRGLFDDFPSLAAADALEGNESYQSWKASPEAAEFYEQIGLENVLNELEAIKGQIPFGMTPLEIAGGRDLALAGRFDGPDLAAADWALYATLNWAGKLAVEALAYPGLTGLEDQGFQIEAEGDYVAISGGSLSRPIHITRIKDVAIIATSKAWLEAAYDN